MAGVANNNQNVFGEMAQGYGRVKDGHGSVGLGNATDRAFISVLRRWAKAFHYRETGAIVPTNGRICVTYFSNANAMQIPSGAIDGRVHELTRNRNNIGDQFSYIIRIDPNCSALGYYTVAFRRSFLAIMMIDFHGAVILEDQSN